MSNTIDSYIKYLRIQKIENLLSKKECSAEDIIKKTKLTSNTVYRIIKLLLKHDIITARKIKAKKHNQKPHKVFKLNKKKGRKIKF